MAVSHNDQYSVVPFDGINFAIWSRRVQAIFSAKELDYFLESEPVTTDEVDVVKSKKAYALLLTLLSDKVVASLQNEDTACKIWKKLHLIYEAKGAVSQILTRKRLATIKKRQDVPMRTHIDDVTKLVNDLKTSGAEVSDMDTIVYILMSLPQEYESVKVALENQPNENLSLDFVSQRLIDSEALLLDSKTENKGPFKNPVDSVAFSTVRKEFFCNFCKQKGHTSKFCKKKKTVCYNCGKSGHFKRDCKTVRAKSKSNENYATSAISFVVGDIKLNKFIIDSGATSHMCSNKEWFSSLESASGTIKCASKLATLEVKGIGNISGKTSTGVEITLKDVLFVPDLDVQLISVKNIVTAGFSVIFKNENVFIRTKSDCIYFGHRDESGQYICDFIPSCKMALFTKQIENDLWHRRLGHSSDQVLKMLGLPTSSSFCEICIRAKQSAVPMGKGPRKREAKPMTMIHTDICGPIVPETYAGERYFMTIVDDHSRFMEVRLLKRKSDAADELKFFLKSNPSVRKIRCDNAKEYVTGELARCAAEAGVIIDPAPPYTPPLNGVAERANRTLLDKGRAMIFESNLPKNFWGVAVLTAAYLRNRLPSNSIDNYTPYYLKYGENPNLKNLRVFGCDAYMLVPNSQRRKLDEKSKKMVFVGYSPMGYRLMDPVTKRITVSRNVKFNEEKKIEVVNKRYVSQDLEYDEMKIELDNSKDTDTTVIEGDSMEQQNQRKSIRSKKEPVRYPNPETYNAMFAYEETLSFDDIATLPDDEQRLWKAAMDEEMQSMKNNDVWDLEKLPPNRHSISCKWVLRQKRDGKYKARLVARGFTQKEGIDYFDTFSPVISMPALRLFLVLILNENLNVFALDVKTAFLNGELKELIYMDQPKGYDDNSGRKCRLKKSLYGLKQAPREWFKRFLNFVMKLGFKQLNSEPCIFIRHVNANKIIMALYVDDLLVAGSDDYETNVTIELLSKEFQMSKSEKASEFLGIKMEFTQNGLLLDQEAYILRLLKKFNMQECKPSATPIEPKSTPADFQKGTVFHGPYRELVGSLLYLAYVSRPDILFAVNCLSQLQEHPTDVAWCALKKILRYLKGTAQLKIEYKKENLGVSELAMYVDADWGANPNDRKSVSGYIIMFCNCPVLWCCNKQKSIALSSTEAEVIALCKGIQDLLWIKDIVCEISNVKNLVVFEDNQSCIKCITNENNFGRLKHIDIKLKFIRKVVSSNNIKIEYVSSSVQIADMLTKSLPKTKLRELLPLCSLKLECN